MKIIKMTTLVVLLAVWTVACKPTSKTLTDAETVEIKSVAWLQAVVAQEWDKTYEFTSPGYRSGINLTQHIVKMASRRVVWIGGEIIASKCDEDSCSVDIRVVFKLDAPVRGVQSFESFQTVSEKWVKLNNEWWLVPLK